MRILQLCKKFPFPMRDGESIAVTYLAKALHEAGHKVTLLAMNTTKHPVAVNRIRPFLLHYDSVLYTTLDNEVKPLHALLNLFSSDSYNVSRFDSEAFRVKLKELLLREDFDLVQLESLYLAPYISVIRAHSSAKIVLRAHNVEFEIWERMSGCEGAALKRWYLEYSARKLRKYELEQLSTIDALLPISVTDAEKFRSLGYEGPILPVPIGLDMNYFEHQPLKWRDNFSIAFIGSLDWMPNVEGLSWFLDEIWPHLIEIFPTLKLHIAGRNCPEWLRQMHRPSVVVEGEVVDSRAFLQQHDIMVVPLLSGSGMRVKIVEAMALGRVVISTERGLEGIPASDGKEVFVADTLAEFVEKLRFCHKNRKAMRDMSLAARSFVAEEYEYRRLGTRLSAWYESLVDQTPERSSMQVTEV